MATTYSNMGLKSWNLAGDFFSYSDLDANWLKVDNHDHSSGKGVQIPNGGIADNAITTSKLIDNAVTSAKITAGTIVSSDIASGTIASSNIAAATITGGNIAAATITGSNLVAATVTPDRLAVVPGARVKRTTAQTIATGAFPVITFDAEDFDQGTGTEQHSTSVNTSRLTCQLAGTYIIGAWGQLGGGSFAGTYRYLGLKINGVATNVDDAYAQYQSTAVEPASAFTTLRRLSLSDYIEIEASQDSGANRTLTPIFWFQYVGA